jgi:hypothetical protein
MGSPPATAGPWGATQTRPNHPQYTLIAHRTTTIGPWPPAPTPAMNGKLW